jgi:hypothetical protein
VPLPPAPGTSQDTPSAASPSTPTPDVRRRERGGSRTAGRSLHRFRCSLRCAGLGCPWAAVYRGPLDAVAVACWLVAEGWGCSRGTCVDVEEGWARCWRRLVPSFTRRRPRTNAALGSPSWERSRWGQSASKHGCGLRTGVPPRGLAIYHTGQCWREGRPAEPPRSGCNVRGQNQTEWRSQS